MTERIQRFVYDDVRMFMLAAQGLAPLRRLLSRLGGLLPARRAAFAAAEAIARSGPGATRGTGSPSGALGIRDVDLERATLEGLAVELGNRRFGLGLRGHLHEPESPRLARIPVGDDCGRLDGPVLGEEGAQALGGCGIGQTTYV